MRIDAGTSHGEKQNARRDKTDGPPGRTPAQKPKCQKVAAQDAKTAGEWHAKLSLQERPAGPPQRSLCRG